MPETSSEEQKKKSSSSEKQLTLAEKHIEKQEKKSTPPALREKEYIPIGDTLKKINKTMLEVFDEVKDAKQYKLMPSFSNAIIKQLEFQAKMLGDIEPETHVNVLNINVVKQEISQYVNKLFESGSVDISKLNSKEFIDGDIVEVKND